MPHQTSFSRARKWSLSLNTLMALAAVIALLVMVNYLAARHYHRWAWSSNAQSQLAPLSLRVLNAVTNPVKVTLYFEKDNPVYSMCWNLLKAYRDANPQIQIESVDYINEPGKAEVVKARFKLGEAERDIVIVECQGRLKTIFQSELSDIDMQPLLTGQSKEIKRTHFKGEALFTSALLNVISARPLKAYFLEGHNEHSPVADDGVMGYSRFAGVLRENNVQFDTLRLDGPGEIPPDCNLLIIAGPRSEMRPEVLDKIERYLKQGGRLFALFNYNAVLIRTGLEGILSHWGVAVGRNAVFDEKSFDNQDRNNMVVSTFGNHLLIKPIFGYQLYVVLPRSISKDSGNASGSDAPQVDPLFYSSDSGRLITDIRPNGTMQGSTKDYIGNVPLAVAVEKGGLRNVSAERGTTRIVVTGDSLFLNNNNIDREANHPFASHAINWLLARNELLVGIPPRPITEYKLTMTNAQTSAARWILMGAFPAAVLLIGALMSLKRRR